ncbi:hypothetical protein RJ55_06433 [Drechmeria coniospora]|nr:hypothetical protein RJ55_06433 [Drechmeria coniospora]
MAFRYSADFLLHLRDSPLCTRPDNLPPTDEWMGAPLEQLRAQNRTTNDRSRTNDVSLLDQGNRRSAVDRQVSRNTGNPDEIVFGPPRTAFASARGIKSSDNDKGGKESDGQGRAGLRVRSGEVDADRLRDGRTPIRRGDADQDSDGWSTVKPRKSFGTDGAERFHGKMGGNFRDDRRSQKDRDDRDATRDRQTRTLDGGNRDKDGADSDSRPRNGTTRNKLDTWRSGNDAKEAPAATEKRDRDRTKSWRDRDRDADASDDRPAGRTTDRRWGRDRDQRVEREPEWLDEPQVDQREAHTQQDFQKWMEQMKAAKSGNSPAARGPPAPTEAAVDASKPQAASSSAADAPDKFFMAFGSTPNMEVTSPPEQTDASSKAKAAGKSSRFTSFFAQPQPDGRSRTEAATPLAGPPASLLSAMAGAGQPPGTAGAPEEERQAFQQLLAKLQKQSLAATPPEAPPFSAPPQRNPMEMGKQAGQAEPPQQFGAERRDGPPANHPPAQQPRDILTPQPQPQGTRPDQLLQDLVGHHNRVSSQGSMRVDPNTVRNTSNTEFLMNLMRPASDLQHSDLQARLQQAQQPQKPPPPMAPYGEREPEFPGRENRQAPRQGRPQPPPGFLMDESFHADPDQRQGQTPQILQRPMPPPGLDQMPPEWMARGQMPPPQQRPPMGPPPGLAAGLGRSMPVPHMFPPNFPPGAMPPPPEAMSGMPPRNMPLPPPGFFAGPPPQGFMPPGLAGFNGPPGPDSHGFTGPPFEARGMPPPGNRGASYGRP